MSVTRGCRARVATCGSPNGQRAMGARGPQVDGMHGALWISGRSLVATRRNLVIARWSGVPAAAQLDALRAALRSVARAYPSGGALLDVIDVGGGPPRLDPALAAGLARLRSEAQPENLGVAHVVVPRGLVGVAIRSSLGALGLVARSPSPSRVFDHVGPAAAWLAERLESGAPGRAERWAGRDVLAAWEGLADAGVASRHAA